MRKSFPGYYRPTGDELRDHFKKCVFAFDTNVLLNLYRYSENSRKNLLAVLGEVKDRIWIPHRVAYEYQRRRIDVLLAETAVFTNVAKVIHESIDRIEKLRRSSVFAVNSVTDPVKAELEELEKRLNAQATAPPDVMSGDSLFQAVTELFDGRVGPPFTADGYTKAYKDGKERYAVEIPPGFNDKGKPADDDKYGDLVLWLQLLELAKGEKRPIMLVTDDRKDDWWREIKGQKTGPRPELVDEFLKVGGSPFFYMYSSEEFLKHAREYLKADVTSEAISEAEKIERDDSRALAVFGELFERLSKNELEEYSRRFRKLSKFLESIRELNKIDPALVSKFVEALSDGSTERLLLDAEANVTELDTEIAAADIALRDLKRLRQSGPESP